MTKTPTHPKGSPAKHLGKNIRAARVAADKTQQQLAEAIGHSGGDAGAFISRLEAGKQQPRVDTLHRIAKVLGVQLDELLKGK